MMESFNSFGEKHTIMAFIEKRELLNSQSVERAITRITHEILEKNKGALNLALIGLRTRGVFLAKRIALKVEEIEKVKVPLGIVDVTLYRDDIGRTEAHPRLQKTEIDFSVTDKTIVLVDDVLFTGRTIRAALDAIMDLGRPRFVRLAVLIDRGNRELPIQANFVGRELPTTRDELIQVQLMETDGIDRVVLGEEKK